MEALEPPPAEAWRRRVNALMSDEDDPWMSMSMRLEKRRVDRGCAARAQGCVVLRPGWRTRRLLCCGVSWRTPRRPWLQWREGFQRRVPVEGSSGRAATWTWVQRVQLQLAEVQVEVEVEVQGGWQCTRATWAGYQSHWAGYVPPPCTWAMGAG